MGIRVPIGVSNRHVHLSQQDAEKLFGKEYIFYKIKDLSQPGQFATKEVISIQGPKGTINKVRVLLPYRKQTQVEILRSDTFTLGISAPIRESGHLKQSAGAILHGPSGSIKLKEGVIIAQRHLHITVAEAKEFGLTDGQIIKIKTGDNGRKLIFDDVIVRVRDNFALDCHIDIDEGNAAGLGIGAWGEIII